MSEQDKERNTVGETDENPIRQLEELFDSQPEPTEPEQTAAEPVEEIPTEQLQADCQQGGGEQQETDLSPRQEEQEQKAEGNRPAPEQAVRPLYQGCRKSRKTGRIIGWLVAVSLLMLAAACIVLICGMGLRAGRRSAGRAAVPELYSSQPEQQQSADTPKIEMYDIPREEDGYTTQYIVEQVRDSVVGILTYDGKSIAAAGGGSGIIMSEDGYIITNAHVVEGVTSVTVVLTDETRHTAKIIGSDEKSDLAVLKISAEGLQPAVFGNSEQVQVGERAIVIGNPGGLTGSVSQGIISATEREITNTLSDGSYVTITVIQTDAAINPGNSGGPLLNSWGQVIGINSSKIVASGYEGIGFSIPISDAQPILDNLIAYGYVRDRAVLGINVIALDATNGPANGLPGQGLYIASIQPGSDLLNHGIQAGDVILKAGDKEMIASEDLTDMLKEMRPGDYLTMEILRTYDNQTVTVDVLLVDSSQIGTSP